MIRQIITNIEALNLTILAQFLKEILKKFLKVLLHLNGINRLALGINAGGYHIRPLVHIGE